MQKRHQLVRHKQPSGVIPYLDHSVWSNHFTFIVLKVDDRQSTASSCKSELRPEVVEAPADWPAERYPGRHLCFRACYMPDNDSC